MASQIHEKTLLAIGALRQNKLTESLQLSDEILAQDPNNASAYATQFSALFKAKQFEQARQIGGQAAKLNPNSLFILNNQACLQLDANQPAAAATLLRSLINQFGERGQWLYNLGLALRLAGKLEDAIKGFERALDIQANHDRAAFQLAECLIVSGRLEEALIALNRVRLLRPTHAVSHAQYIHHAVANQKLDQVGLKLELRYWQERFIPKQKQYPIRTVQADGPITLAFNIGNIPEHWLTQTIAPTINTFSERFYKVIVYWQEESFKDELFDGKVTIVKSAELSDAQFAQRVRNDRVDALIDVCGLRRGTRQRALGLQLASIQCGWMAHEGDYAADTVNLIEDHIQRLPFCLGEKNIGTTTVGTEWPTNTLAARGTHQGISDQVLNSWGTILNSLEDWKLHLDCQSLSIQNNIKRMFSKMGINSERLLFNDALSLNSKTIVLDNFINNDPIAIGKALGQGGIVVALKGEFFPAQRSAKVLSHFDRGHWLVNTPFDYQERVISLANNELNEADFRPISDSEWRESDIDNIDDFCDSVRAALLSQQ